MSLRTAWTALLALLVAKAYANTEKTIFVAPPAIKLPEVALGLDSLQLDTISDTNSTLQTLLPVAFPTESHPRGLSSWFLLRGLTPGQRYEVRVCWAAIVCSCFYLVALLPSIAPGSSGPTTTDGLTATD